MLFGSLLTLFRRENLVFYPLRSRLRSIDQATAHVLASRNERVQKHMLLGNKYSRGY